MFVLTPDPNNASASDEETQQYNERVCCTMLAMVGHAIAQRWVLDKVEQGCDQINMPPQDVVNDATNAQNEFLAANVVGNRRKFQSTMIAEIFQTMAQWCFEYMAGDQNLCEDAEVLISPYRGFK